MVTLTVHVNEAFRTDTPGADPGFPVGKGDDPGGVGGANIRFCPNFPKTA